MSEMEEIEKRATWWRSYTVVWVVASVLMLGVSLWRNHVVMSAGWGIQVGYALCSLVYDNSVRRWRKMVMDQAKSLEELSRLTSAAITEANARGNVIRRQEWLQKSPPY